MNIDQWFHDMENDPIRYAEFQEYLKKYEERRKLLYPRQAQLKKEARENWIKSGRL